MENIKIILNWKKRLEWCLYYKILVLDIQIKLLFIAIIIYIFYIIICILHVIIKNKFKKIWAQKSIKKNKTNKISNYRFNRNKSYLIIIMKTISNINKKWHVFAHKFSSLQTLIKPLAVYLLSGKHTNIILILILIDWDLDFKSISSNILE